MISRQAALLYLLYSCNATEQLMSSTITNRAQKSLEINQNVYMSYWCVILCCISMNFLAHIFFQKRWCFLNCIIPRQAAHDNVVPNLFGCFYYYNFQSQIYNVILRTLYKLLAYQIMNAKNDRGLNKIIPSLIKATYPKYD